ncbi:MAG: penicillin-binding protein 2, partial [Verrucomicrobia bacterium]|nr:penicillin-binding protein 2 [Verrucomicrobiota bacterium]
MSDCRHRIRFTACVGIQSLAMVGLGLRLAFLHLGPYDDVRDSVKRTRQWTTSIEVERGRIFDRSGDVNILALDLALNDVCVDPHVVVTNNLVASVASTLADLLDLPADEVAVKVNRVDRRYACIKPAVQPEVSEQIAAAGLTGVFMRDTTVRYYPHHDFMCHVLGFVNMEGVGSAGVEQRMDKFLRGSPGVVESEKNALRQELYWKRGHYIPALEGADIHLTTDQVVQYIVEQALDDVMVTHNAKGAWAIVQRVRTGEILAMASRPSFDLNDFRHAENEQKLNRTISVVYEPGSTLKAIVFAAALNEGMVTPETMFNCENGSWHYQNRPLRDFHPYGNLSVADGLKKSSNIMAAKLAIHMGDERLYAYQRAFGLGHQLGVDLPGEEMGILSPVSQWSKISSSRMAIGQGVATTAMQVLSVYAAIANDGVLMRP